MDKSDLLRKSLARIQELKSRVEQLEAEKHEQIAVVGIGVRFPAGMSDPDKLWQGLLDGVDVISEIPETRWPTGQGGARFAGMLEDPYGFEPGFFGITEREARAMDPQQRLLLEVGWDALADAGLPLEQLRGSRTGVYVGAVGQDWTLIACGEGEEIDAYTSTGGSHAIIANRLSYVWDLRGPSVTIDAACASSLVATHYAVAALRSRECDVALAGGVQLHLAPQTSLSLYRFNMMAADGRCKAFDSRADGFVRAEGCGLVVLKRLSDALASRDRIYAVICGSALGQDGRSNGLTAPNPLAQVAVLKDALANAHVDPAAVTYIETHGTGTALGDPIEVGAIKTVYGAADAPACYLGAIKTNLGHTEATAGIAGLIKAALVLHHGRVPKNLHFVQPNPDLAIDGTRFRIPVATEASTSLQYAAVSSFGFGGTNAHVILGRAPQGEDAPASKSGHEFAVVPVSAHSADAVVERARQLATVLDRVDPRDLAHTAALRTTQLSWRATAVGSSSEELRQSLAQVRPVAVAPGKPRVVFLFPGQGGQWPQMAAALQRWSDVFAGALDECDRVIGSAVGWSVSATIADSRDLDRIDRVQFAIFAMQVALMRLWQSHGVHPDVVLGTSMGELAAAHCAGLLSLESAVQIIAARSRLVTERLADPGGMLSVALTQTQARALIDECGSDLELAIHNGPANLVLAGSEASVEAMLAELHRRGVFARRVKIHFASHSSLVEPWAGELVGALRGLRADAGRRTPMLSTVTCNYLEDATAPEYWRDNLRQPVRLWPAISDVLRPDSALFVEISPHPILMVPLVDPLTTIDPRGHIICGMARDKGPEVFLDALGAAWSRGVPVDWRRLHASGRVSSFPSHPWARSKFAGKVPVVSSTGAAKRQSPSAGDLEQFVLHTIAEEMGVRSIDELPLDVSLREMGFDSLMASHLRAALVERDVKVKLIDILQAPGVRELIEMVRREGPSGGGEASDKLRHSGPSATPQLGTGGWLTWPNPRPTAELVCVCLPFGGGAASAFRTWGEAMPAWLDVCAVEYPGRGTRAGEAWSEDFEQIAEQLAEVIAREISRPFILYGHCAGAVVAYETAKRLLAAGREPLHLCVAARCAPAKVELLAGTDVVQGQLHEQDDAGLLNFLRAASFRGVDDIIADPELQQMAFQTLRADSRMAYRYRRQPAPPLTIPITAIGGGQDPSITPYDLWGWAKETSAAFDWRWFPDGDHYFQSDHIAQIAEVFAQIRAGEVALRPQRADGLGDVDIVRSYLAARGDGPEAWRQFIAADAEWTTTGLPGAANKAPELRSIATQDVVVTRAATEIEVACSVSLELSSGEAIRGRSEERYVVQDGRIVRVNWVIRGA
jgi:acyl transferase domain-containing protein/surfactin synthase thioesterase subunit